MNPNHSQSGSQTSHLILMLLCCLIPIGLILAVSIFGLSLGPLNAFLPFALVLLCPLLMFFMMRGMGHKHDAGQLHDTTMPPTGSTQPIADKSQSTPTASAASSREQCH